MANIEAMINDAFEDDDKSLDSAALKQRNFQNDILDAINDKNIKSGLLVWCSGEDLIRAQLGSNTEVLGLCEYARASITKEILSTE